MDLLDGPAAGVEPVDDTDAQGRIPGLPPVWTRHGGRPNPKKRVLAFGIGLLIPGGGHMYLGLIPAGVLMGLGVFVGIGAAALLDAQSPGFIWLGLLTLDLIRSQTIFAKVQDGWKLSPLHQVAYAVTAVGVMTGVTVAFG